MTDLTVTLYYPGDEPKGALEGMPYDDWNGAEEFRKDNGLEHVFSVTAVIDTSTVEVSK